MDMLQPLIDRLMVADLSKVAGRADVSRKTLTRIRDRANSPTLATVGKILKALDELKVPRKPLNPKTRAAEEQQEA